MVATVEALRSAPATQTDWVVADRDRATEQTRQTRQTRGHSSDRVFKASMVAADIVGLLGAFAISVAVLGAGTLAVPALAGVGFAVIALVVMQFQQHYRHRMILSAVDAVPGVARALVVAGLVFTTVTALVSSSVDPLIGILAVGIGIVTVPILRAFVFVFERRRRRRGAQQNVLVLGMGDIATELAERIDANPDLGMRVVAFADYEMPPAHGPLDGSGVRVESGFDEIVENRYIDHVIVAFSSVTDETLLDVVRCCGDRLQISVVPRLFDVMTSESRFAPVSRFPLLTTTKTPVQGVMAFTKRTIDVMLSAFALLLTAPLLAAIAIAIKLDDGGAVLFRQERVGRHGKRFNVLKFRTMVEDAEARLTELRSLSDFDDVLFKMKDDPRITRVGRFLRKHSLDELPQFINVLVGDMSTIGPRPPLPSEVDDYPYWFHRRLEVRPGITGMWQISGRSDLDFSESTRLDLYYVDHWSPWLDIKILVRTVGVVLFGHGSY